MNAKTGSTGFYREDAARLASEAARRPQQALAGPPAGRSAPSAEVPEVLLEPQRPLLAPEPATNQNEPRRARPPEPGDGLEHARSGGLGRIVAWILLAPLYTGTLVVAVGIDVMFIRGLLRF
ncbi:MAG TPA: hypothetical protein VHA07_02280 [Devosia sp.]|nr:hypothetical protein [Devosia sp.]